MAATNECLTPEEAASLSPEMLRIYRSAAFGRLRSVRRNVALALTMAMCTAYFGFLGMVAFAPRLVSLKVTATTTLGIALSMGVVLMALVLTAIYVWRANAQFDHLAAAAVKEAL